ncbi:MAG: purine-nucleoside phosphorylase [Planctomycetes bacterium]|nr:purine-nucleoside phosphorylase [Planctomycetota bacterium]
MGPVAIQRSEGRRSDPVQAVAALADELAARGAAGRALAIVLGSGLGAVSERLTERRVISGSELEHLPRSRVHGHAGEIVLGELAGVPVLVQSGRVHLYEGRDPFEVTRLTRAFARLGVRTLLLTNAAGGIAPTMEPGTFLCLSDHLNLQGQSPLFRGEGARSCPYDAELGADLERAARELRIPLERGIYAGMLGPAYETPAEIRLLASLGAHAVGMSTVAEASAARAAGLRVAALSCIANRAAGLSAEVLSHEDVLSVMRRSAEKLTRLLERVVPGWARAS